ncbi:TrmB family transcriptional regulator [Lachnospiraceae bacterium]|nr:TrmB family transcriptional regulator [Lachnospiraceae bacterium]
MEEKKLVEDLTAFGLTGQEALIYLELFRAGTSNGYELSKCTGISRSNVYKALEALAEKGAAYVSEGTSRKYTAMEVREFCQNKIASLARKQDFLIEHMPKERKEAEGYITIVSDENIADKIRNMLLKAEQRVYLSMSFFLLLQFQKELRELAARKIKVVVLTSFSKEENEEVSPQKMKGIKVYATSDKKNQIGIITDSKYVLTGELGKGRDSTCLYTGQVNFVQVFKNSMKNEIRLLELEKEHTNCDVCTALVNAGKQA